MIDDVGGFQHDDLDQFLGERLATAHAAFENIPESDFVSDPADAVERIYTTYFLPPLSVAPLSALPSPRITVSAYSRQGTGGLPNLRSAQKAAVDIAFTGPHFLWNHRPAQARDPQLLRPQAVDHLLHAGPLFVLTLTDETLSEGEGFDADTIDSTIAAVLAYLHELADRINTETARWHQDLRKHLLSAAQDRSSDIARRSHLQHHYIRHDRSLDAATATKTNDGPTR